MILFVFMTFQAIMMSCQLNSTVSKDHQHTSSNILVSALSTKYNHNHIYDANNAYRLQQQSLVSTNSIPMVDKNIIQSTIIKSKNKLYCYSTEVTNDGQFDIICNDKKKTQPLINTINKKMTNFINQSLHYVGILNHHVITTTVRHKVVAFQQFLSKHSYTLKNALHHKLKIKIGQS